MTTARCLATLSALALGLAGASLPPVLGASQGAAVANVATDPAAIMSRIYAAAVKTEGSAWLDPAERPKYLSKGLVALWAQADAKPVAEGDAGPIDFDITADTNGLQLTSFVVRVPNQGAETATVAVELGYQEPYVHEGRAIVTYDFIREEGRWVIDNIRTEKWSVRDLLKLWLKPD